MPKVLVLFDATEREAERLADIAADGARSVRFTEVDVRVVGENSSISGTRRRPLESPASVEQYDGVVFSTENRDISSAIERLLNDLAAAESRGFVDRVFGLLERESAALTGRTALLGGILVVAPRGTPDAEAASRETGARVAKVCEWMRHSLNHDHADHAHHNHGHHHAAGHHAP